MTYNAFLRTFRSIQFWNKLEFSNLICLFFKQEHLQSFSIFIFRLFVPSVPDEFQLSWNRVGIVGTKSEASDTLIKKVARRLLGWLLCACRDGCLAQSDPCRGACAEEARSFTHAQTNNWYQKAGRKKSPDPKGSGLWSPITWRCRLSRRRQPPVGSAGDRRFRHLFPASL